MRADASTARKRETVREGSYVRRHGLWLIGLLVAFVALAATYNFTTPVFETPDEIFHYVYVRHLSEGQGLPRDAGRGSGPFAQEEAAQPPLYYIVAAALTFWAPRGDLNSIARTNVAGSLGDPRTDGNKNRFLHGPAERFPWSGEFLTVHLVRFTTTLWGAATVFLTYLSGRVLFRSPWLAIAAAAIVAFTPEFLFMSSAVSNDVAVAAAGALLLFVAARVSIQMPSVRGAVALGIAGGAVVMSKPIAVGALGLIPLAIVFSARRSGEAWRNTMARLIVAGFTALAIGGWWFAYNRLSYGSWLPLGSFLSRSSLFDQMPSATSFISDLNGLRLSYWALFGWFSIAVPSPYYWFYDALTLLGLAGLFVLAIRAGRRRNGDKTFTTATTIVLAVVLFVAVLLGVFAYRLIVQAFHGRLMFGATSGIALLLALGWASLGPTRLRRSFVVVATSGLGVSAVLFPWTVIRPAYQPPRLVAATSVHPVTAMNARFGDEIRLLGVDLGPDQTPRVGPGGDFTVRLYLQALKPPAADYMLFLKVVDADGKVVADLNSYPGHGTYQTSLWTPGPVLIDRYQIHLPSSVEGPSVDHVDFGFFRTDLKQNLPTSVDGGESGGSSVRLGSVVVQGQTGPAPSDESMVFHEGGRDVIALVRDQVSASTARPGSAIEGDLLFSAVATPSQDYTIFVHLERDGVLLAQDDAPPLRGRFPTSFWAPGDLADHRWHIAVPPGAPAGDYALKVGWYDPRSGARLQTPNGDSLDLRTIRVE
jgi:4-amino-4-deoxy-L-arabinose transferase-like glycosyltransferase